MIYQVGDLVMYNDNVCYICNVKDSMVSNSQIITFVRRDGRDIKLFNTLTAVVSLAIYTSDNRISPADPLVIAARDYKERKD